MARVSWVLSDSRTPESVAPVRSSGVPSVRSQVSCWLGRRAQPRHQQSAYVCNLYVAIRHCHL